MTPGLREYEFTLPVGYTDPAGRVHRRAVLQKMRGHEEALLYDPALSSGRLVTELLRHCLVRLGELPEVTAEVASGLYSADRNYLVLELRRITLGDSLEASYACPGCGGETQVQEELGKLPVQRLAEGTSPESLLVQLEDGYQDREGNTHTELRLRLPRGLDEELVTRLAEGDPLRMRDVLILRCIESFGTLPRAALEAYGLKILRDLTLGDRRRIYQALDTRSPGVDFRRRVRCAHCGTHYNAVLEASGFFALG